MRKVPFSSLLQLLLFSLLSLRATATAGEEKELSLDVLFQDFVEVSNTKEVVLFMQAKIIEENVDMMRVVNYLNSTNFKAINDHMWTLPEFMEVITVIKQRVNCRVSHA